MTVIGARYTELAERLGVGDRVVFHGRQADVPAFYTAADAVVLASNYETFSLVAHEAAATGVPLVATRVHGIDELLDAGGGIEIDGSTQSIARALVQLNGAAPAREAFGQAARSAAEQRSTERMIDGYLGLYERVQAGLPRT